MSFFVLLLIVGWLAGIILSVLQWPLGWAVGAGVFLVVLGWRASIAVPLLFLMTIFPLLGYVLGYEQRGETTQACTFALGEGEIVREPELEQTRIQYVVALDSGCNVLVYAPRWPVYELHDRVEVQSGTWQSVEVIALDLPGYAAYLRRLGIDGSLRYPELLRREHHVSLLGYVYRTIREATSSVFLEPDAGVVRAMLLADEGGMSEDLQETFRLAGVSHVLAISGSHLSLFAALLWLLVGTLPLSRWWRALILLLFMWVYIILVGAPASVVRAGVFWTMTLLWLQLGMLGGWPSAVLMALLVMVTVDPLVLADVGFQLSLAAVVGIMVILFAVPTAGLRDSQKAILVPLLATLGATLTTAPLIAYHFGVFSPGSLLANALIVPVSAILLAGSLAAVVGWLIWPPLGLLVSWSLHPIFVWMYFVSDWVVQLPLGVWEFEQISAQWIFVCYACFGLMVWWLVRWQGKSWREVWV